MPDADVDEPPERCLCCDESADALDDDLVEIAVTVDGTERAVVQLCPTHPVEQVVGTAVDGLQGAATNATLFGGGD